jgi:hypothetical protein
MLVKQPHVSLRSTPNIGVMGNVTQKMVFIVHPLLMFLLLLLASPPTKYFICQKGFDRAKH